MGRVMTRALAVIGAALIVWSVSGKDWWTFAGGSRLFDDMEGRIGPYVGRWCSDVFCHDQDMSRYGSTFDKIGFVVYFAGLVTAAAAVMAALAGKHIATLARTAAGAAAVTVALAFVLVAVRHNRDGAAIELGPGLVLLIAGAIAVAIGCLVAAKAPPLAIRPRPLLGRTIAAFAALLVLIAISSTAIWRWSWSDERNSVGLHSTERCWVHPSDRTICSTVESIDEIFMNDHEKTSRFARSAAYTFDAGIAAIILGALVAALGRRRWWEQGHAIWIVLLESACAMVAMTPFMSTGRDVHIGYGFVLLVIGCVAGITGHLLAAPAAPDP
jgi:hypothetical protein